MNDEMNTYTGRQFNPMKIQPEDIRLEDIAHALSLLCRGGGHLACFYSVGQHSLNCAKEAQARQWSGRVVLACLLHDASEAYISDIIRPVKRHLTNYLDIEAGIMKVILEKFGLGDLTEQEKALVKLIDNEMLEYELAKLFKHLSDRKLPRLYSDPVLEEQEWRIVEREFLGMARRLMEEA